MKIEMWKIAAVKPYEQNPRINDAAVDSVSASIKEFGFRQPLVVDKDGVIIIGHTRWKAAQKLGLEKVPVHVADLPLEKARALRMTEVHLRFAWRMNQRHEQLAALPPPRAHRIFDHRVPAAVAVLGFQPLENAFGRMPLLRGSLRILP